MTTARIGALCHRPAQPGSLSPGADRR